MILIAESGSSKTQWCIVDSDRVQDLVQTPGINPFNLKGNEIEGIISQAAIGVDIYKLDKIYFFGAGCSSSKNKEKVHSALFNIFKCDKIEVDTDLKAACLALAGDKAGIICLMGTGSNSCFWDGSKISSNIPSLGYILGDEGGGVSIGKQLSADYLKLQMPPHLRTKFSTKYDISTEFVLERVYQMQMPNRYLAGFTPFAEENIDDEYCRLIVYNQFKLFIERNILHYSNPENLPLYFCGSIAFSYKEILNEICNNYNLRIDKIVKEPINDLAFYYKYKMKY
ncbi:MAG: ATPase [Prolixibacteraceae bacterium]|jgi:glucosamine kinase|nr:ATPase [Prolixibacteraceae bacterium]